MSGNEIDTSNNDGTCDNTPREFMRGFFCTCCDKIFYIIGDVIEHCHTDHQLVIDESEVTSNPEWSFRREPDRILGAAVQGEELLFIVKWKDPEEVDIIPSSQLKEQCPQAVIQYYEQRRMWETPLD